MNRTTKTLVALGLTMAVSLSAGVVAAHPDHGGLDEATVVRDALRHQHGGADGHLDPVRRNVRVVGNLDLFASGEQPGRVADVAAFGNYAYLGAFREPVCEAGGGVYVVDISDPTAPEQAGFISTTPESYVGEGVQVLDMETAAFDGQVLIHNNESCLWVADEVHSGLGGISLWDVTDPTTPSALAENVGDEGPTGQMHQVHSAFGWQDGDRAYVVMTDDDEAFVPTGTDIDIMEITDPANPVLISETHIRAETTQTENPPLGNNVFLHDMVVKEIDGRMLMLASYWDGGYSILKVDNPSKPVFLRDTDFAATEPFAAEMGLPQGSPPEGNAHQAEFSFDNRYFLGADEDFDPLSLLGAIDSGPFEGDRFAAGQSNDDPQIDTDSPLAGPTTFIGDACTPAVTPAASADHVALIERGGGVPGTCTFMQKMETAEAAGYQGAVIFNDKANCETVVANPLAAGPFPMATVARSTGLKLLGDAPADPCTANTPAVGTPSADVRVEMVQNGWGYVHLFDTRTMEDLDQWAIPEALDVDFAEGFGDLSIHEVAMDPRRNVAYVSHYSGGFRVLSFGAKGIREVGAFIAEGGNNFWGVEYHQLPGAKSPIVLASDRDSGLWIFQHTKGRS